MKTDPERMRQNACQASAEDLLDRITAFRESMEPEAIPIIEAELRERGIGPLEIHAHRGKLGAHLLCRPDGSVEKCSRCRRPAVAREWTWFRLWRVIPLFPWKVCFCRDHASGLQAPPTS